jgi:hypothetical protein
MWAMIGTRPDAALTTNSWTRAPLDGHSPELAHDAATEDAVYPDPIDVVVHGLAEGAFVDLTGVGERCGDGDPEASDLFESGLFGRAE